MMLPSSCPGRCMHIRFWWVFILLCKIWSVCCIIIFCILSLWLTKKKHKSFNFYVCFVFTKMQIPLFNCFTCSQSTMSWRKQRKATSSSRKITSMWQPVSRWWSLCTSLWCPSIQPESGTTSALSSTPPSGHSPCTTWQFHMQPMNGRLTSSRPRSRKSRRTQRWWETVDVGWHLLHACWESFFCFV